ncbi:WYL domain-containing protein [soil metagenome]
MMRIHAELKARRFPNCRKVAEEFEVSSKTIQRDIEFMRDRLALPIDYDPLRFGYYYTSPVTSFPSIEVSEGEIAALFVAQKALAQYQGTPFEKPLRSAFRKITTGLKDRVAFSWDDMDDVISFHSAGASVSDLELFETVSQAVLHSVELHFEYRKLNGSRFEQRRVQPYHIASLENQWYLFALDLDREQLRTFALPRMRKARASSTRFRRPANFSINEVLRGSFGVFQGGATHRIRLQFDAFAARLVSERTWHESQRIRSSKDGGMVLELQLGGLEEIERWVLSWGSHVSVLEPKALADSIRNEAVAVAGMYADEV